MPVETGAPVTHEDCAKALLVQHHTYRVARAFIVVDEPRLAAKQYVPYDNVQIIAAADAPRWDLLKKFGPVE